MSNREKKFLPVVLEGSLMILLAKAAIAGVVQAIAFCITKSTWNKNESRKLD